MTREEAVLLIAECLVEPHFDDAFEEASYILAKLEKADIAVPPINKEKSFKILPSGEMTYEVREWEDPE